MKKTSIGALVGVAVFVAAASAILTTRFYGSMLAIPATVSITLWAMTFVCSLLAWKVYQARKDDAHGIGLDSSQLNPITVAQFLLVGKASAWTGTIVGSAYAGVAIYVVPNAGELLAAQGDLVGVLTSVAGGAAMAVAGLILEHQCEVTPPSDNASVAGGA